MKIYKVGYETAIEKDGKIWACSLDGKTNLTKVPTYVIDAIRAGGAEIIEIATRAAAEKKEIRPELATLKQLSCMDSLNICYAGNVTKKHASFLISDAKGY